MTVLIDREANDRLLELAYPDDPRGCRHGDWRERDWNAATCGKCGKWFRVDPGECFPAVGDGHTMDLEEMIPLAVKLGFERIEFYFLAPDEWAAHLYRRYNKYTGEGENIEAGGDGDTPKAALRTAILAAVDGERG